MEGYVNYSLQTKEIRGDEITEEITDEITEKGS